MATNGKRNRLKAGALRRFVSLALVTLLGVLLFIVLLGTNSVSKFVTRSLGETYKDLRPNCNHSYYGELLDLPKQTELSIQLEKLNQLPPRNRELYPKLAKDHITIVLYVHNRPKYLQVVVDSLSKVVGISETLLIVSHDGYFEEMNKIVESIKFCQVKQIFAPYSPHVFPDSFPGVASDDCKEKDDAAEKHCLGNTDQYGNHRSPKIVSLKHHWWWMMNTVWDGLEETKGHSGHFLFIEEDHFIFPNAYRNLQILTALKPLKCPNCYAANLAPCDVNSRGENWDSLAAERMGNVGYSFNRTVWRKIHMKAKEFCFFDDYNWDITMWATVYPSFGGPVYTLRGPRTSAVHFGKCGLHQGHVEKNACIDNGVVNIAVEDIDKVANINSKWKVHVYEHQPGYKAGFRGWGGWGDDRDRQLCLKFADLYRSTNSISATQRSDFVSTN
ncbi:beta-1,2-n-acetylglucosaminyltransferase II, putative [Ricinus communis]|uniref:Alpha-1,6-mannosyl-glycoprotein 2-beta-N-acetylglucosaminyltransferase n=1 Tax=Ricinus communis TaxID=3988 RepID=B9SW46_RICCO|nr:beta-1,2-n-acetylglucosaminyltransferase II, putative [Ricinus communis]|eukprot:XP_002530215.1 alpha-1,6-mannosyl-glycoprotein 2-beta-N-acetylglucosaminyltransferase [Ricinus communis]